MATQKLRTGDIQVNSGTQMRVSLNQDTIDEYAELWDDTDNWPFRDKAVVFYDEENYHLSDGFHRHFAAVIRDKSVYADVRKGTLEDAKRYALEANAEHGLRRSNMDKRNAVVQALGMESLKGLKDRESARMCKVSNHLVADVRLKLTQAETTENAVIKEKSKPKKVESSPSGNIPTPPTAETGNIPNEPPEVVDDTPPLRQLVSGQEIPEDQKRERLEIIEKKIKVKLGETRRLAFEITKTLRHDDILFATDAYDADQDAISEIMEELLEAVKRICEGKPAKKVGDK